MSPEEAERLAIPFGLTYLSREGYAKLAMLLSFIIQNKIKRKQAPEQLRGTWLGGGWGSHFPLSCSVLAVSI